MLSHYRLKAPLSATLDKPGGHLRLTSGRFVETKLSPSSSPQESASENQSHAGHGSGTQSNLLDALESGGIEMLAVIVTKPYKCLELSRCRWW